MRKDNLDPARPDRPDRARQGRLGNAGHGGRQGMLARLTPARIIIGLLALCLLVISAACSLIIVNNSYASTGQAADLQNACTTPTVTPTATTASGVGTNPTTVPTTKPTAKPTAKPTKTPVTPTPTATPVTPTVTPVTPTVTPSTPTGNAIGNNRQEALRFTAPQCTPTATVGDTQTPTVGITPTSTPVATGGNTHTTPPAQAKGGDTTRVAVIVGGVFLVLLFSLAIGWFFFRRMLLPQSDSRLPPSGARPWSRTRAPNPDSLGGLASVNVAMAQAGANGSAGNGLGPGPVPNSLAQPSAPAGPRNSPNGPAMNNGMNMQPPAGFVPQGMNGNGPGGFSDGFIPPSPQIFPQSEGSMIPPGSGAFPVITSNNGFAPASQAFNAMYGLPDDPFSASKAGAPGWIENLGNPNGNGQPRPQAPGGPAFSSSIVDLNDPHLDEVIRQYSKKSEAMPPEQPQAPQEQRPLQSIRPQPGQQKPASPQGLRPLQSIRPQPGQQRQQLPRMQPPRRPQSGPQAPQVPPRPQPGQQQPSPQIPQRDPRSGLQ